MNIHVKVHAVLAVIYWILTSSQHSRQVLCWLSYLLDFNILSKFTPKLCWLSYLLDFKILSKFTPKLCWLSYLLDFNILSKFTPKLCWLNYLLDFNGLLKFTPSAVLVELFTGFKRPLKIHAKTVGCVVYGILTSSQTSSLNRAGYLQDFNVLLKFTPKLLVVLFTGF